MITKGVFLLGAGALALGFANRDSHCRRALY
jgi:hypothetical protein